MPSKQSLTVFDLDHTLLLGNSSYHFGKFLFKKGSLPFSSMLQAVFYYAFHQCNFLSLHQLHERIFQSIFYSKDVHNLSLLAQNFVEDSFAQLVNPKVFDKLKEAQNRQDLTSIMSSSPDFLVRAFAHKMGVTNYQASNYFPCEEQKLSSFHVLTGKGKALAAKTLAQEHAIPKENIIAYSDSHLDIDLLEFAEKAIAVNPSRKLHKICIERNWETLFSL